MIIKNITQYLNFRSAILCRKLELLYDTKCRITNNIIKDIGNLCSKINEKIPSVWKSKITNFCIEYVKWSKSWIRKDKNDKNIRYCVARMDVIFPIFDLKNMFDVIDGNLLLMVESILT